MKRVIVLAITLSAVLVAAPTASGQPHGAAVEELYIHVPDIADGRLRLPPGMDDAECGTPTVRELSGQHGFEFAEYFEERGCGEFLLPVGAVGPQAQVRFFAGRTITAGATPTTPVTAERFEQSLNIYDGTVPTLEFQVFSDDTESVGTPLPFRVLSGAAEDMALGFWFADISGIEATAPLSPANEAQVTGIMVLDPGAPVPGTWSITTIESAGHDQHEAAFQVHQTAGGWTSFSVLLPPEATLLAITGPAGRVPDDCLLPLGGEGGPVAVVPPACPGMPPGEYRVLATTASAPAGPAQDIVWTAALAAIITLAAFALAWAAIETMTATGGPRNMLRATTEPAAWATLILLVAAGTVAFAMRLEGWRSLANAPVSAASYTLGALMFIVGTAGAVEAISLRTGWANTSYQQAVQAKGRVRDAQARILRVAAHELRTPLTPLQTNLQLLGMTGPLNAEQTELVKDLQRNTDRFRRLVEGILEVQLDATGGLPVDLRPVEVGALVLEAVGTAHNDAERRGLTLSAKVDEMLPAMADPDRLHQVLANCIHNSFKFTPKGGQVAVGAFREGDDVVIQVTDDGQGISPKRLPGITDALSTHRDHGGRTETGMGLGLAICAAIARSHGGSFTVDSKGAGRGTSVRFTWPAGEPAQD